jgi:hypothetical protein
VDIVVEPVKNAWVNEVIGEDCEEVREGEQVTRQQKEEKYDAD